MIPKPEPIEFKISLDDIGLNIMDNFTKGLYTNPKHVIREYVQNAFDAQPKEIDILVTESDLKISDDGTGMDKDGLRNAIRLARSEKKIEESVGFRGIGIWAGVFVAKRIIIRTKCEGDVHEYVADIDTTFTNKFYKALPITELQKFVKLYKMQLPNTKLPLHYTIVELKDIWDRYRPDLTNLIELKNYIGIVLPVPFNSAFEYNNKIRERLLRNLGSRFKEVVIKLNGEQVFKPFTNDLEDVQIIALKNKDTLGYCWYGLHKFNKKFKDPNVRRIIYKHRNFTVGGRRTVRFFEESEHLMEWVTGEIHVIEPGIIPNSERTDFEDNESKRNLQKSILKEFKTIEKEIRQRSDIENSKKEVERRIVHSEQIISGTDKIGPLALREDLEELKRRIKILKERGGPKDSVTSASSEIKRIETFLKKKKIKGVSVPIRKYKIRIKKLLNNPALNPQSKMLLRIIFKEVVSKLEKTPIVEDVIVTTLNRLEKKLAK